MIYKMIRHRTLEEVIHVNLEPEQLEAFKRMEDPADWEDDIDLEVVQTVGILGATCGDQYLMDTIELLPPLEQLAAIRRPHFVCASSKEPRFYKPGCVDVSRGRHVLLLAYYEMVYDEGDICETCTPHIEGAVQ
jgi:hypothetical protein